MALDFDYQYLDDTNIADFLKTVSNTLSSYPSSDDGLLIGIVSEADGGIIAYALGREHADKIVSALHDANGPEVTSEEEEETSAIRKTYAALAKQANEIHELIERRQRRLALQTTGRAVGQKIPTEVISPTSTTDDEAIPFICIVHGIRNNCPCSDDKKRVDMELLEYKARRDKSDIIFQTLRDAYPSVAYGYSASAAPRSGATVPEINRLFSLLERIKGLVYE